MLFECRYFKRCPPAHVTDEVEPPVVINDSSQPVAMDTSDDEVVVSNGCEEISSAEDDQANERSLPRR